MHQRGGCRTPAPGAKISSLPGELFRLRRPTAAQQRLEYRYWRAAELLVDYNNENGRATERLWNQLHCLIDTHGRYFPRR